MKLLIVKEHYPDWTSLRMTRKYPFLIGLIMKAYYRKKGYEVRIIK